MLLLSHIHLNCAATAKGFPRDNKTRPFWLRSYGKDAHLPLSSSLLRPLLLQKQIDMNTEKPGFLTKELGGRHFLSLPFPCETWDGLLQAGAYRQGPYQSSTYWFRPCSDLVKLCGLFLFILSFLLLWVTSVQHSKCGAGHPSSVMGLSAGEAALLPPPLPKFAAQFAQSALLALT